MRIIEDFSSMSDSENIYTITENYAKISGLWYIRNYLSQDEITMLHDKIANEIIFTPISSSKNSRCVAHYGYYYSYDKTGLKTAPAIPEYLAKLVTSARINDVIDNEIINQEFDQVIINEYKPGQQIAYHTDHTKLFGSVVACLTIGQAVSINFRKNGIEKRVEPEEGSLYIMTDKARYEWQHSLVNSGSATRYSITYRTIIE